VRYAIFVAGHVRETDFTDVSEKLRRRFILALTPFPEPGKALSVT